MSTLLAPSEQNQNRLELKAKQLAHDGSITAMCWLPDHKQDILFTGGADGTLKRWNISGTATKYANLFEDEDGDENMNESNQQNGIKLELTNTAKKSIGISPITDIKIVPVTSAPNTFLMSVVCIDAFVKVFAVNTNENTLHPLKNQNDSIMDEAEDEGAGIDIYRKFDMNERSKVYLCDANGNKPSHPTYLEQFGGCWSSDINTDCSVVATGDQFGQIYLWSLYDEENVDEKKKSVPTVLSALVPQVKLHLNRNQNAKEKKAPKTLRGAHAMTRCVTFNRRMNPNWLAVSCQAAQRVEVFDILKCVSIFNRKLTYKEIRDVCWYSGGSEPFLCVGCDDHFVHVYDTSQNKKNSKKALIASLASHKSCVTSVDFGKKQYVASSSMDCTIKLWDLHQNDDKLIETHCDHSDQVWKVRFSPNNDKLASVGDDGYLNLYTMRY